MLRTAAVTALVAVGVQLYEPQAWPLWIIPVVSGIFGLVYARLGFTSTVHTAGKWIRVRDKVAPFDRFVGVLVNSQMREVATEHGTAKVLEWTVGLISGEVDAQAAAQLDAIRQAIDGADELTQEARGGMIEGLGRWQSVLERTRVPLVSTPDEHDAWRIAERMAKTMDVPMVDFCGNEPLERTPAQLDLSLADRLRSTETKPEPAGPAPSGMVVDIVPSRFHVQWSAPWNGFIAVFTIMGIAVLGAVWLGATISWVVGLPVAVVFGLGGIGLVFAARGRGGNALEVEGDTLVHVTRFPWTRRVSMPLAQLEHVRQQTQPQAFVSLVSDAQLLRLPLEPEPGQWLVRALEHWLVGKDA